MSRSESMESIRVIPLMSLVEIWDGFERNEASAAVSFWNGSLTWLVLLHNRVTKRLCTH